jgi:hypothetical protein
MTTKNIQTLLTAVMVMGALLVAGNSTIFAAEGDSLDLEGKFNWTKKKGEKHDIKGTFVENKNGEYDATFYFTWRKKDHVYTGIVKGDPDKALTGDIFNDDKKRKFTFQSESKDGEFKGKHQELKKGELVDTGEITFKLK